MWEWTKIDFELFMDAVNWKTSWNFQATSSIFNQSLKRLQPDTLQQNPFHMSWLKEQLKPKNQKYWTHKPQTCFGFLLFL